MAAGDIKIQWPTTEPFATPRAVASGGAATINNGEPTKSAGSGNVAIMVDADGTTSQKFSGIAKSVSTDTASAAGIAYVFQPWPGLVYAAKAKTASNANTQALITALTDKRVVFDLTGTVWTIDTGASNATTNCVVIVGGDFNTSTIFFAYSPQGTIFDNPTTA